MSFEEAKSKSLKQIVETEFEKNVGSTTFYKLVDAKIGIELADAISRLIGSNEKLARSNEKYSRALCLLTAGLVGVGLL